MCKIKLVFKSLYGVGATVFWDDSINIFINSQTPALYPPQNVPIVILKALNRFYKFPQINFHMQNHI